MTQFKGVAGGKLNVAAISAGDYFFPRLLVEFIGRHPGVTLNFTVHNREGLLLQMAANLTDLACMVRPPPEPEMESDRVRAAPVCDRRCSPDMRWSMRRTCRWRACCASRSCCARRARTRCMRCRKRSARNSHSVKVAMEIRSTETIKQAVMAGHRRWFFVDPHDRPAS